MKILMSLPAVTLLVAGALPVPAHASDAEPLRPGVTTPTIPSPKGPAYVHNVPAADIAAAMAAAKAATQGGQQFGNREPFLHRLFYAGPNMVSIENRPSPAPEFTLHKTQYELFYVLEGSGKMYTGGMLVNPTTDDARDARAKSATGGVEVALNKGDVLMVPPSTVHSVTQSDGNLVLLVTHMPAVDGSVPK